jgi:hypothetical protein
MTFLINRTESESKTDVTHVVSLISFSRFFQLFLLFELRKKFRHMKIRVRICIRFSLSHTDWIKISFLLCSDDPTRILAKTYCKNEDGSIKLNDILFDPERSRLLS